MPAFLASRFPGLLAVGVDLKALHLRFAPASVSGVVADVRRLPFAPGSFDVVTASLFLHHFDAAELPAVLASLFALARRALLVNDLRRALVPYAFGRALFPLLFRSPVSVADGLVSIRRAFRPDELRAAFAEARVPLAESGSSGRSYWPSAAPPGVPDELMKTRSGRNATRWGRAVICAD